METLVANLAGKTRHERWLGRDYLVAPLTLIVPGVLPGSKGPLYYPPDEVAREPDSWNHVPIVVYHPTFNGTPTTARRPDVLERQGVGYVFNAGYRGKLRAEGWFDIERTKVVDPRVLTALEAGNPFELSTGLYTDNEPAPGGSVFNSASGPRPYTYIARNYRPDHLAVLPDRKGACSVADGCGVLVNELIDPDLGPVTTEEPLVNGKLSGGQWVTIEGRHVYIKDGKIIAGPPGLKGKSVADPGKGAVGTDKSPGASSSVVLKSVGFAGKGPARDELFDNPLKKSGRPYKYPGVDAIEKVKKDEKYPVTMLDPAILHSSQENVRSSSLERIKGDIHDPIIVVRHEGKFYIEEGNHRAVKALMDGKKVPSKIIDVAEKNPNASKKTTQNADGCGVLVNELVDLDLGPVLVSESVGNAFDPSQARDKSGKWATVEEATAIVEKAQGRVSKAQAALAKAQAALKLEEDGLLVAKKGLEEAKGREKARSPAAQVAIAKAGAGGPGFHALANTTYEANERLTNRTTGLPPVIPRLYEEVRKEHPGLTEPAFHEHLKELQRRDLATQQVWDTSVSLEGVTGYPRERFPSGGRSGIFPIGWVAFHKDAGPRIKAALVGNLLTANKFNSDQPRDSKGRWMPAGMAKGTGRTPSAAGQSAMVHAALGKKADVSSHVNAIQTLRSRGAALTKEEITAHVNRLGRHLNKAQVHDVARATGVGVARTKKDTLAAIHQHLHDSSKTKPQAGRKVGAQQQTGQKVGAQQQAGQKADDTTAGPKGASGRAPAYTRKQGKDLPNEPAVRKSLPAAVAEATAKNRAGFPTIADLYDSLKDKHPDLTLPGFHKQLLSWSAKDHVTLLENNDPRFLTPRELSHSLDVEDHVGSTTRMRLYSWMHPTLRLPK